MAIDVRPLGDVMGAEITGLDLGHPLDPETFAAVEAALDRHLVLVFPGQELTPQDHLRFSRHFGELDIHFLTQFNHPECQEIFVLSNEVVDGHPLGMNDAGSYWHSDYSFRERPALATILHALKIPADGGDTLFANMYLVLEGMPADLRRRIEGRRALHRYRKGGYYPLPEATPDADREEGPGVLHPMIRMHPVSGRKGLFAPVGTTAAVDGLPEEESRALLRQLFEHSLKPEYQFRYKWRPKDFVMWDNRWTQHCATSKELSGTAARTLHRTTVIGDPPVAG